MKTKLAAVLILCLLAMACGPTTYVAQPYNPGYDPNSIYYDDGFPSSMVYVNGIQGYYVGSAFYPMIMLGGVGGYYDSGHRFHTNTVNRTTVINNYNTGRTEYERVRTTSTSSTSRPNYSAPAKPASMPNYGNNAGGTVRSAPTTSPSRTSMPNYSSSPGGTVRSAPSRSMPSYGNSSGSVTRSAPSSSFSSRPSYGSSSSSSRSSSSSSGRSTRR